MGQPSGKQMGPRLSLLVEKSSLLSGEKWLSLCGADSFLMLLVAACSRSRQRLLFLAQDSYSGGERTHFSWL